MSMRYPGGLIATTPVNQQYPSGVWTGPQTTPYQANNVWGNDPYFKNTSLLLHGDGPAAPFIKDSSVNNFNLTINGDTRADSKTPFTPPSGVTTYGSGYFDGSGDYLTSPYNINWSTLGSYTLEFWVYHTSMSAVNQAYASTGGTGYTNFYNYANGRIGLGIQGTNEIVSASGVITANQWYHVAYTYNGTTTTVYVNGVSVASGTTGVYSNNSAALQIANGLGGLPVYGYMSNFRLVNSVVYTTAFTPPTSPLAAIANTSLLTLQSNVPVNNNVFFDSSPNNYAITRTGSITQGSFTPYNAGYYSNYFDGSGDYLQIPNNSALDLGAGNFTVEFWLNTPSWSSGTAGLVGKKLNDTTNGWQIYRDSGQPTKLNGRLGLQNNFFTTSDVTVNVWEHWALVRTGTTLYWFKNGVLDATGSSSVNVTDASASLNIAYADTWSAYGNFYLSNLRIVKGTAVYTSNFTPSTTPLTAITNTSLLTCQSNRFIDNSTNAFSITKNGDTNVQGFQPFSPSLQYTSAALGGAGYFFGASNNLATPSGTCPVINDFSASGWVYRTSVPGYQQTFFAMGLDGSGRIGFFWTGSNLEYNIYGSSTVTVDSSGSMPVGAWTYVVITRTGSTLTLYYNGTLKATVTLSGSFSASSGRSMSWMDGTIGYATNLRFDTAAYSSPTTVPTAPVSYTANTNNLLNFTNTGIFDNAMQNALVTEGDAKLNTSVVKYGTGSMYFDGTGDTLTIPGTPNLFIGTGNFTAEGWIYPTSVASARAIISFANNNVFYLNTSAIPYYGIYTVSDTALGSTPVALNTWTHIAFVRNGTTLTCYLNGVSVGSTTTSSSIGDTTTSSYVGSHRSSNYWLGYIDDLRITKGVARYVTNFTPPVARMPNQ